MIDYLLVCRIELAARALPERFWLHVGTVISGESLNLNLSPDTAWH